MERWSSEPADEVLARWRELSDTIGKKVRVELPDRIVEGIAQDIDASGALVIDGAPVSAGSVTVLNG
jgi:BirA family biotin operon repressor/biotin-[acetyl-CoA-carboxylase] ligase